VAQEESARQTTLHLREIAAHKITDAKLQRAKEAAEAANLAKSRYVVGISHELRTPLNAVLGYAQLLEGDPAIPALRQGGIRVIRRSAEHLSGLIDGLLDISKMEAGRLQLYRNEIRLADFLDQVVDMFRLQAQTAGLEFRFTRPETLPAIVSTDEKRLRQILINLLSNAIKFTAAGQVSLGLAYRSEIAEFTVADTGAGIPDEDMARIFEPFNRGTSAAVQSAPGTGLGLTIANMLAQIMGGEITVTSRVGVGSTFRVRLMLSAVRLPADVAAVQKPIRGYAGPRRTILVVDDDVDHRELMREILVPLGFTLMTAPDGATCLDLVERCQPDLFLLDLAMPGMNGWELAGRLRTAGHTQAVIVMMSANVHEISPLRGADAPHDDMVPKPFDLRHLLDRVGVLLDLEWRHDLPPPAPEAPRVFVRPRSEHVDELIHLGRIGYVRGIEAKLTEIETDATDQAPFVQEMRQLVQSYDLRRYMAVLEGMRTHG
jgi:CheY-like chemotaxis protein